MGLMLETDSSDIQDNLDQAQSRFEDIGCDERRIRIADWGLTDTALAAAPALLGIGYPTILSTALAFALDDDAPETLPKVTQTK